MEDKNNFMRYLIITKSELNKFPILSSCKEFFWMPINNKLSGEYYLQLKAQSDLNKYGINYTIGEVEIKQDNLE